MQANSSLILWGKNNFGDAHLADGITRAADKLSLVELVLLATNEISML